MRAVKRCETAAQHSCAQTPRCPHRNDAPSRRLFCAAGGRKCRRSGRADARVTQIGERFDDAAHHLAGGRQARPQASSLGSRRSPRSKRRAHVEPPLHVDSPLGSRARKRNYDITGSHRTLRAASTTVQYPPCRPTASDARRIMPRLCDGYNARLLFHGDKHALQMGIRTHRKGKVRWAR
jgi:hypothetical protein